MRGSYWLYIGIILFIVGLIINQIPMILVALLLLLVTGITKLWEKYCLTRIEYQRKLNARRVFFGEEVELEIEIANRKPLPLPWVEIDDEIPSDIVLLKGKTSPSHRQGRININHLFSLCWYHKIKRRYRLSCQQRGLFTFGPTGISSGDIFGFFKKGMEIREIDYLTVYPRILPLQNTTFPSNQPVGDIRTKRYIFEDPILTRGVREYQFGDSLRSIHWKTTARLGKLQTKVFEPTTSPDIGIFLDVRTVKPPSWGSIPNLLELVIITAASLCNQSLTEGYKTGLYINQGRKFSGSPIRILPSQHPEQLPHILETLAQIHSSFENISISRFIPREARNLPWGSSMVVISAAPTESLLATLTRMQRAGRRVSLISVGNGNLSIHSNGFPVYYVPDDIPWNEMQTLEIKAI